MSGEKTGLARLNARAQRELERTIDKCRAQEADLAKTANLAGRVRAVQADVELELAGTGQATGFRESMKSFQETAAVFEQRRQLVRGELDALAALGTGRVAASSALGEAQRRRDKVRELVANVAELASDLEGRVKSIQAGLQAEGHSREYRAGAVDRERRARLEGLREELDCRLHGAAECSLGWAAERPAALRSRIEGLRAQPLPVSQSDVDLCAEELGALVGEAERRYAEDRERLEIFHRVGLAFAGAGFSAAAEARLDAAQDAIVGSHFRERGGVTAEVRIFRGGRVRVLMSDGRRAREAEGGAAGHAIWEVIANVPKDLEVDRLEWTQAQGPPIRLAARKHRETRVKPRLNTKAMEERP